VYTLHIDLNKDAVMSSLVGWDEKRC